MDWTGGITVWECQTRQIEEMSPSLNHWLSAATVYALYTGMCRQIFDVSKIILLLSLLAYAEGMDDSILKEYISVVYLWSWHSYVLQMKFEIYLIIFFQYFQIRSKFLLHSSYYLSKNNLIIWFLKVTKSPWFLWCNANFQLLWFNPLLTWVKPRHQLIGFCKECHI